MRGCYAAIPGNGFTSPMVGARLLEDVEDLLVYLERPIEFAAQCEVDNNFDSRDRQALQQVGLACAKNALRTESAQETWPSLSP
jgi:hypothetical protein